MGSIPTALLFIRRLDKGVHLGIPYRGSLTREGTTIEALSSIRLDLLIVELVIHFLFDFEVICWSLAEQVSGGAISILPFSENAFLNCNTLMVVLVLATPWGKKLS
jgi:hypothetical protein